MRAPLAHLVDRGHRQPRGVQRISRACSRDQREAHLDEAAAGFDQRALVLIAHRDEDTTLERQVGAAAELGLRESTPEIGVEAHHLTGRFHLRTKYRIDPWETRKREDCLLHRDMAAVAGVISGIAGPTIREALTHHHPRSNLCDWGAGSLGDERHRAGSPRIDFKDEDHTILNRELYIHQSDDAEGPG